MVIKLWSEIKNKKALSTVVATVLMILLVMVAASIVWAFVNNIVKSKTEGVQSCFDATSSGKVTIEDSYTCYQPINNKTSNEVQFSINIGDVSIDSLIVSILVGGNSKSFTLTNNATDIPYLRPYTGDYGDTVKLPGKNEGKTYVADFSAEFGQGAVKVDSIRIAPVVEGKQCDQSDETNQIDFCSLYEN
jgi:FlaG/FlaF family flagellin (archaellin)